MSPHARGLHPEPDRVVHVHGIIPARAGFTIIMASSGLLFGDHPRSRGVYLRLSWDRAQENGSSPLARGLLHAGGRPRGRRGIIPARAGFTTPTGSTVSWPRDHPRSRGVYPHRILPANRHGGSSPLARGLHMVARTGDKDLLDHPRSRGVYPTMEPLEIRIQGSSPLARGLLGGLHGLRRGGRIIPARAGFTTGRTCSTSSPRDHPRSRGVYSRAELDQYLKEGSSPLARGLLSASTRTPGSSRIIPARAGFTCA